MRKTKTHVPLDCKSNRYTVFDPSGGLLAIHDNERGTSHVLWSQIDGNRHWHPWNRQDAYALADWLNERAASYPKLGTLPKFQRGRLW